MSRGHSTVPDFQGLFSVGFPIPLALPGADLFGPFGAKSKTAQRQNWRVGLMLFRLFWMSVAWVSLRASDA
jgi:hypothetical protein